MTKYFPDGVLEGSANVIEAGYFSVGDSGWNLIEKISDIGLNSEGQESPLKEGSTALTVSAESLLMAPAGILSLNSAVSRSTSSKVDMFRLKMVLPGNVSPEESPNSPHHGRMRQPENTHRPRKNIIKRRFFRTVIITLGLALIFHMISQVASGVKRCGKKKSQV